MIPEHITRSDILRALKRIDRAGVDPRRRATRFHLLHDGRRYPPKLAISVASEIAGRTALAASDFSGGSEANSFLEARGFRIVPSMRAGKLVATILLERGGARYSYGTRLTTTKTILDALGESTKGRVLLLFPGGWFHAGSKKSESIAPKVIADVRGLLSAHGEGRLGVSFGLDGRRQSTGGSRDQTAIMLTSREVLAAARKFYPTKDEAIDAAASWDAGESGFPRIGTFDGRRYYLAVCYDGFGIKHRRPERPEVDAVLDHVHGFAGSESEVLFARHGFAGASQVWACPVYGAAAFVDRSVPPSWPSCVLWRGKSRSTMEWKYSDNKVSPLEILEIDVPEGRAVVRIFRSA